MYGIEHRGLNIGLDPQDASVGGGFPEIEHAERKYITPWSLIEDNNSPEANSRMTEWHSNYINGRITLLIRCSDARLINPDPVSTMTINAVAATEDFDQYIGMLTETPFQNIAFVGHFNGEKLRSLKKAKGCGAHDAWEEVRSGKVENPNGIFKRVVENLISDDPVIQVNYNARNLADFTRKPVLALVQDHRTGENIPVGIYYTEGDSIHGVTHRDLARLQDGRIEPEDAYWSGTVPCLQKTQILSSFYNLIESGDAKREEYRYNSRFHKSQDTQNPQAVYLGVDFQPIEVRFPNTFRDPNTGYRLLVPRRSTNERLTPESISTAIDHAEYPLRHAVRNYGKGGDFADTDTLIVETKKMSASEYVVRTIASTDFGKAFLALSPNHRIIMGETRKGKLVKADWFVPRAA